MAITLRLFQVLGAFGLLLSTYASVTGNEAVSAKVTQHKRLIELHDERGIRPFVSLSNGEISNSKPISMPVSRSYNRPLTQQETAYPPPVVEPAYPPPIVETATPPPILETAYPPPIISTELPLVVTDTPSVTLATPSILEITMIFPTNTPSATPSPTITKIEGTNADNQGSGNAVRYGLIILVVLLWLLLGGWLYLLTREK